MSTLLKKQEVIYAYRNGLTNMTKLGKMYGLPRTSISDIVNHPDVEIIMDIHPLVAGELWIAPGPTPTIPNKGQIF
jgi:predicted RecB family nuclease